MAVDEAFTRCWTQAQPVVARYVNTIVADFNRAEDILQDVAVVLMRRFSEYDPARPFVAWALAIAKYKILELHRTLRSSCLAGAPDILDSIAVTCEATSLEAEVRRRALQECLGQVRGRALKLLELRYEQCLKPQEIARKLGAAAGAIRVALTRVRALLQECIERRLAAQDREA